MSENKSPRTPQEESTRWAVLAAQNTALNALLFIGLSIYLAIQTGAWQAYTFIIAAAQVFVCGFISAALIRRGRNTLGGWLILISDLIGAASVSLLISDLGYVAAVYILIATYFIINYAIPKGERRAAVVITGIALLIPISAEIIAPPWRLVSPLMLTIAPIFTAILGIVFIAIILRQAWLAGRLNFGLRLTIITLLIVIPVITGTSYILVTRAASLIEAQSAEQLRKVNQTVASNVTIWLNQQALTLGTIVTLPDIVSMEAEKQIPILETYGNEYPQIYLVHTMDTNGMNVARNDGGELRDYSGRGYFTGPASGEPVVYQSLISRTTGQPAVCMGSPIKNLIGNFVGVGSMCSELAEISQGMNIGTVGETGFAFVLDDKNQVIAHPDSTYTAELSDFSEYPPVVMLRNGQRGSVTFTDTEGQSWHANIEELENGWGVIVQQNNTEYLATRNNFQLIALITVSIGVLIIAGIVWFTLQQSVRPVLELTRVAEAISAGDLAQTASEDQKDEFGVLAQAFNSMTTQLRDLISSLEQQIAARTQALETSTEVSRRLSTILDQEHLVREVVEQLRSSFGYYHAQIYLYDENKQNLVMAGGTGEAGRAMLARNHSIERGHGLVGQAAEANQIVLIPDISQAEGWLPNPLLPDTCAEIAVPIAISDEVLGVLDVQHNVTDGLGAQDSDLIQAIANQVAIAVQNAQAYTRSQRQAVREAQIVAISQRIQSTGTIEEVLKVAIQELGQALKAEQADVEIRLTDPKNGDSAGQ